MCSERVRDVYVASCVETGGIYHYKMVNGSVYLADIVKMDRPMYMVIDNHKMYVVLRAPFENGESGVVVYDIDEDGRLINPSKIVSTKGEVACHIAVHRGKVYCANYTSGSVIRLPDKVAQHEGTGIHPTRQEGPHVHYVGPTPDGQYLCATDLGLDTIFLYDLDLVLHSCIKVPDGHGVRHLAFSEDGNYLFAANELGSTVAAFSYDNGRLEYQGLCSCLPQNYQGESTASAIRVKDGLIYVSNRGHDSIAVLEFKNNKLNLLNHIDCGGRTPRDFDFIGDYLFSTNQDSNGVAVLDVKNGFALWQNLEVEEPICVCSNMTE